MKRLTDLLINENNIKESLFAELDTEVDDAYRRVLQITKNQPELAMQAFIMYLNSKNPQAFKQAITKIK